MGAFYDSIPSSTLPLLPSWIRSQKLFFVATAPLSDQGHVNLSPKGHTDALFELVDDHSCWYVDLTGSGNETLSHLRENGRITILFVAFQGPPRIVRLFGTGKVFERESEEFERLLPPGDPRRYPGVRAIIWIDIHKVGTSCGYSIPFFKYEKERNTLIDFMDKQEKKPLDPNASPPEGDSATGVEQGGMIPYWELKNATSIDGLPGLRWGQKGNASEIDQPRLNGKGSPDSEGQSVKKKLKEIYTLEELDKLGQNPKIISEVHDEGDSQSTLQRRASVWENLLDPDLITKTTTGVLIVVGLIGWLLGFTIELRYDEAMGMSNRERLMGLLGF